MTEPIEYKVKWNEDIKDIGLFDANEKFKELLWKYILDYTQGLFLIEKVNVK